MIEFIAKVVVPILAGWKAVDLILWGVAQLKDEEARPRAVLRRISGRLARLRR